MNESPHITYHQDGALFRAALRFTSAELGFSERLVEKDYFCSVVLADLSQSLDSGLGFKGGTSLSKVHAEFFRLSEDLDFAVSMSTAATRNERRQGVSTHKERLAGISKRHTIFRVADSLQGFNNSTQYSGRLAYTSTVTGQEESIKIEISVRELIVEPLVLLDARTMLLDPFRRAPAVAAFKTTALSLRETYAEKLRAALSRREPAIRDIFDVDHLFSTGVLSVSDTQLIELLRAKLAIPGNDAIDISSNKISVLHAQIETDLRPVLRAVDFDRFKLDRAMTYLAQVVSLVKS